MTLRTAAVMVALLAGCVAPEGSHQDPTLHLSPGQIEPASSDATIFAAPLVDGPTRTLTEPTVAIDPTDPRRVIAFGMDHSTRNEPDGAYSTNRGSFSVDGGITWNDLGPMPLENDPIPSSGDPVAAIDTAGVAYFNSLVSPEDESRYLFVYRSYDGGRTWDSPTIAHRPDEDPTLQDCESVDKNWIATGPEPGHIVMTYTGAGYVCGTAQNPLGSLEPVGLRSIDVYITQSRDEGRTWSPRTSIWSGYGLGSTPVVARGGTIHVAFFATVRSTTNECLSPVGGSLAAFGTDGGAYPGIVVATSRDYGASWTRTVHDICGEDTPGGSGAPFAVSLPAFALDRDNDALYVAYVNYDRSTSRRTVDVIASGDGGRSWSPPVDVSPGTDGSLPALATHNGTVWVMYRADGHTWVRSSTDIGVSWSTPQRISNASAPNGGGDYTGLAAAGGRIVAAWSDDRGGSMEIWTHAGRIG